MPVAYSMSGNKIGSRAFVGLSAAIQASAWYRRPKYTVHRKHRQYLIFHELHFMQWKAWEFSLTRKGALDHYCLAKKRFSSQLES
jgi:hypothetical protein